MTLLLEITRTGLILLTAIGTLAAGSPHFDCVCPDGSHKPYCLGFSIAGRDCCGTSCCTVADEQDELTEAQPACPFCSKHETPSPRNPVEAKPTGCQKTWQSGEFAPAPSGQEESAVDLGVVLVSAPPAAQSFAAAVPEAPFRLQFKSQAPPPTDLVVALQHFNI